MAEVVALIERTDPITVIQIDPITAIESGDETLLDVGDLCRMFEESEESTYSARQLAERDRDYYDHKQWTADEKAALKERRQPEVTANRIQPKINFLVGLEKSQRIDPRALPRTPKHEQDADGASQALKYVADTELYDDKRSNSWKNMLIEGAAGIEVAVEPGYDGEPQIKLRRVPWDRMFWDPHSSDPDFEDAGYRGLVIWKDYDEAIIQYPDGQEALETTMAGAPSETYDDKPKWNHWADKKRKRVRICQIWVKRDEQWYFAEFTKGGILKAGPSPYQTDTGESDCGLFFQSAYVDRDNNRYGLVRIMVSLQDEINKRRSKALHLLSTNQTTYEEGAVDDIEKFRREKARPDGTMKVNPGALSEGRIVSETRLDLAQGQVELLQESKNELDQIGPNATMMGEKAGGSSSASGKAIIASQQGGMMEVGDLLDNLRHLDKRVFRAIWNRIRQYWTAEKWIRTTDDERNVKWVAMNVDPMQLQMLAQQNPEMAQSISGVVGSVAELDCDIIIDEAPDNLTPQLEQFQALVELKKMDVEGQIPFRAIVESIPNLKNRQKFLEHMDEQAQQPKPPPPELQKAQLDAQVRQQEAQQQSQLAAQKMQTDTELAARKQQADAMLQQQKLAGEITLAREKAAADIQLQREKAEAELELRREIAAIDAEIKRDTAESNASIAAERAKRQPERASA